MLPVLVLVINAKQRTIHTTYVRVYIGTIITMITVAPFTYLMIPLPPPNIAQFYFYVEMYTEIYINLIEINLIE